MNEREQMHRAFWTVIVLLMVGWVGQIITVINAQDNQLYRRQEHQLILQVVENNRQLLRTVEQLLDTNTAD